MKNILCTVRKGSLSLSFNVKKASSFNELQEKACEHVRRVKPELLQEQGRLVIEAYTPDGRIH